MKSRLRMGPPTLGTLRDAGYRIGGDQSGAARSHFATRRDPRRQMWVKPGKAHSEHNESGLPPKADMERTFRDFRVGPRTAVCGAARASYSITSSARSMIDGGTVRPSALAVLRLMTNSYFVGNCTGRSPGFSPRRMRST